MRVRASVGLRKGGDGEKRGDVEDGASGMRVYGEIHVGEVGGGSGMPRKRLGIVRGRRRRGAWGRSDLPQPRDEVGREMGLKEKYLKGGRLYRESGDRSDWECSRRRSVRDLWQSPGLARAAFDGQGKYPH